MKETESKTNLLDISIVSIISWTREIYMILHDDKLDAYSYEALHFQLEHIGRAQYLSLWLPEIVPEIMRDPGRRV